MVPDLRLEVTEFTDLAHWQWTLTDANGAFLADHDVRLDPTAEHFEAFADLQQYISWHAAPDERHPQDEKRIVAETGDWISAHVLGDTIMQALADHRPATVRVILLPEAEALAALPLEIARADGKTLAERDITLITQTGPGRTQAKASQPEDRLRVLGLFSLPDGGTPLNLRRERHSLVRLIQRIAASGRAADVKVLQYGVTRDRLRDVLEEADGWDIIHVSGHGTPGELILETETGVPDRLPAADMADLLEATRERVKLVTLAACWSATPAVTEQRRLLRLPAEQDQRQHPQSPERPMVPAQGSSPAPALATELTTRLGCVVLGMRYPVDDEFAINLSERLYDLLARQGQPLPRAVALTLKHLAKGTSGREFPALSMAAPALFGMTAGDLKLRAPQCSTAVSYQPEALKLAGFPRQPDRFVGRTGVMTCASAALSIGSGVPGVLLHGMPGGGKTACALELAYTHESAFDALIWYKAPDDGMAIDGALTDFALTLERSITGLPMIDKLTSDDKLDAFLPTLTELMERNRLLIIIDNAESLLTDTGQWRDDQWRKVFGALTGHTGYGKVIATTRRAPAGTSGAIAKNASAEARPSSELLVESVDALTLNEALLLVRELPNLRALIYGELPGIDSDTTRTLARGVLSVAQGHPKLLELADGQAADPDRLAALVESGDQAWREQGGVPEGFFGTGETAAAPGDYLHVLAAWTNMVTDGLASGARDLFWFLCCLEEPDRERSIIEPIWPHLWQSLGRDGQSPGLHQALTELSTRGLATIPAIWRSGEPYYVHVHPGVAAAGRDHAGQQFQQVVDTEAAECWDAMYRYASGENDDGRVDTGLLVRAGLATVPYLIRGEQWDAAGSRLHNALARDASRAHAAAMLPVVQQITRHDPRHADTLAIVLEVLDPAAAETQLRAALDSAAARGDYRDASAAAGRLADLCTGSGRLPQALALTKQAADYTRQAGLGPWTQLADEVRRLRVLDEMGQTSQVLAETQRLRPRIDTLPATQSSNEIVLPWAVREMLLSTGRRAAIKLGRHNDALALNAAQIASRRDRRAPAADIARARFHDYAPLLRLGRTDEALELLQDCLQTFHHARDIAMLGSTLAALADLESNRGHGDAAIRLQRDALRYTYLSTNLADITVSYHNLGEYIRRHAGQPAPALAAHLAAALMLTLTGIDGTGPRSAAEAVRSAAIDLRTFGTAAELPADIADLCSRLADIEGTDLPALIKKLSPDSETAEQTLRDLIAQARALAEEL